MAILDLSIASVSQTSATIHWELRELGAIIARGGLCTQYPDGSQNAPGTILSSAATRADGELKAASGNYVATRSKYPGGSLSCYGFGRSTEGYYYPAGGGVNVISWSWPEEPARPTNWEWWSDVRAGQPVAFTAAEFQAFYDKIDAFRIYRGVSAWPNFIPVSRGTPISADIVNEARAAIAEITTAPLPPTAYPGDDVSERYFNALKDYLNSVP